MPRHRPFLVDFHGPIPTIRIVGPAPISVAREAFARLGTDWPLTVLDRELGETTEWWIPEDGGKPAPLHLCACGAPIRPTGERGRPWETCQGCREEAA